VGQAVVVGDGKPYLTALFALDPEQLPQLCKGAGVEPAPLASVVQNPTVRAYIEKQVEELCNKRVARYQSIKKFELLPAPFSVETGEMTPSLKVKRNVVNDKFAHLIDAMYAGSAD
jgi:long-chain acyl-CoA synthetase